MQSRLAVTLLALSAPALAQGVDPPQRMALVDLSAMPTNAVQELAWLDLDIAHVRPEGVAEVVATDADLEILLRRGIPFEIEHADLAAHYASRLDADPTRSGPPPLGAWLSPAFGQGSMGGYWTFSELLSVLDQMGAAYPTIMTARTSLGPSIEGRQLWMVKISDNPGVDEPEPEVRFDALHHAREPQSMHTTLFFMLFCLENYGSDPLATYLVDEREMFFVPCVNPDGYVYNETTSPGGGGMWRKNRRANPGGSFGVDINRNYPFQWGPGPGGSSGTPTSSTYRGSAPASEPEIQAMVAFMTAREFETAISCHTYGDIWIEPWGYIAASPPNGADYAELSSLQTAINGYLAGPGAVILYVANGTTIDEDQGAHDTMAWTPEIGSSSDGFWPATSRIVPLAEINLEAFQRTALGAGAYMNVGSTVLDDSLSGDGDGFPEPTEIASLVTTVRNSGNGAPSGPVTLTLATSSPDVTVLQAVSTVAAPGPFAAADDSANPIKLGINAFAVPGSSVDYTLTLSAEGLDQVVAGSFDIGERVPILTDDIELDLGWSFGVPSDGASTGLWERGDPVGTTSSGQPSNPSGDTTPGAGVNALVTGNGGGSSGNDDVDGNGTTLTSPALDLSGVSTAIVSYDRWFANLGSPTDDQLDISISDDGGATWVAVESVTSNANAWQRVELDVGDFVALTDDVRLRFYTQDEPNNSIVEAALDELAVETFDVGPRFNAYGLPQLGAPVALHVSGQANDFYGIYASTATGSTTFPGVQGTLLLDPTGLVPVVFGTIPSGRLARVVQAVPVDNGLIGLTLYLQAGVLSGSSLALTGRDELTFVTN